MKRLSMVPSEVGKVAFVTVLTRALTRWFPLAVISCLLVGCSSSEPEDLQLPPGVTEGSPTVGAPAPTTSASPTTQPTAARCPNEATVAGDPARQIGPSTSTDVDGDGAPDEVKLAADPEGGAGCAAFVAVDMASGDTVAAPVWEIGTEGGLPQPRVHGFVNIDGRPGNEILIDEAAGASTQFVGAFVYEGDSLQRITVKGGLESDVGTQIADLFPYGGSVGHIEAVDCAADATVVISSASPSSVQSDAEQGIYEIERRFYVFDGSVLERDETETHRVPVDQLNRFPEYSSSPFGSC